MSPPARDSLKWRVAVSLVLVVLLVGGGVGLFLLHLSLKKEPPKAAGAPPRTVVRVQVAEPGRYRETVTGYGRARALRAADVAAEVPAVVTWTADDLEAGAAVAGKPVLLRLDDREYREALRSAEARLEQTDASVARSEVDIASVERRLALARDDLESAQRELERVTGLVESGVETRSALDRQKITTSLRRKEVVELESRLAVARQDLRRGKAERKAAAAAEARARLDLERTEVRAPWDGRIATRRVSPGDRVAPGTVLFSIVDLSRVEVPVRLGASHFGDVGPGAAVTLRRREGGEELWTGKIARTAPAVDAEERTFLAYAVLEGDPDAAVVPPGAFVFAEIEGRVSEDVIPVPRVAFVEDRVYLAEPAEAGEAIVRECRPEIARLLPHVALVGGGIEAGARIVVTNLEQIAAGSRVRLHEGEEGDR